MTTAIATPDDLTAGLIAATRYPWHKGNNDGPNGLLSTALAAANSYSTWQQLGAPGCSGANPSSTPATLDNTSDGAGPLPAVSAGNELRLVKFAPLPVRTNILAAHWLYDRLAHVGGLSGSSTSLQSFSLTLPAREATGLGVELFMEVFGAAIGGTSQTLTITYTNSDGTASRTTTLTIPGTTGQAHRLYGPIPLQAGDFGVRSVQSIQWGGSTGAAGNMGIVLARRIACSSVGGFFAQEVLDGLSGLPRVDPAACLWVWFQAGNGPTSFPTFIFDLILAETGQGATGTKMDDCVVAANYQQVVAFTKRVGSSTQNNGVMTSLWDATGSGWTAGSYPSAVQTRTQSDAGALQLADAGGGRTSRIARWDMFQGAHGNASETAFAAVLWDRLADAGSYNANVNTLNSSINMTLPTRGVPSQVVLLFEVQTATGATGTTLTVTYTNENGTGSRTATLVLAASALGQGAVIPVPLQSGDKGVTSVQSCQLSAATGAGTYGLVLAHLVALSPCGDMAGISQGAWTVGYRKVDASPCHWLCCVSNGTSSDSWRGQLLLHEFGGSTTGGINTVADVQTACANKVQNRPIYRDNAIAAATIHTQCLLFTDTNGQFVVGATPGAWAGFTKSTGGALPYNNASGGRSLRLMGWNLRPCVSGANAGFSNDNVGLWDVLGAMGGLSGTSTSVQNTTTTALSNRWGTNQSNGVGVFWCLICWTATGSTSVTATVTYTNQSGTGSKTTTCTIPATWRAKRLIPIYPAAGDTGIKTIESVQLSASTLTAGNFGVIAMWPIAEHVGAMFQAEPVWRRGAFALGQPKIPDDCCVVPVIGTAGGNIHFIDGEIQLAEG